MANILLMEDDAVLSFQLRKLLEKHDHDVYWANGSSQALDMLEDQDVDLLITDMYVHRDGVIVEDGGTLLIGRLRTKALKSQKQLPIIAISGARQPDGHSLILDVAKGLGARFVLPKPFKDEELLDLVDKCLA